MDTLTFQGYQDFTEQTSYYPDMGNNLYYPTIGLAGEMGEVCNLIKKIPRDHNGIVTSETRAALLDELGDVLWYVARLASELNIDLGHIVQWNVDKLKARHAKRLEESGRLSAE